MLTIYNTKADFEQSNRTVAVLPIGAVEQHGSHLPVGTDALLASELGSRLAHKLDAYLLPVISISSSIEHRKGKGTVYIKGETLALMLRDIAESLCFDGFKTLIIYNIHGGNWIIKPTIRRLNREMAPFQTILINWEIPTHKHREILKHQEHDLHGGEDETSVMTFLYPDLIGPIVPQADPEFVPQAFMDYFDVTDLTQDGYWGFPEEATAEKGERMVNELISHALAYISEIKRTAAIIESNQKSGNKRRSVEHE